MTDIDGLLDEPLARCKDNRAAQQWDRTVNPVRDLMGWDPSGFLPRPVSHGPGTHSDMGCTAAAASLTLGKDRCMSSDAPLILEQNRTPLSGRQPKPQVVSLENAADTLRALLRSAAAARSRALLHGLSLSSIDRTSTKLAIAAKPMPAARRTWPSRRWSSRRSRARRSPRPPACGCSGRGGETRRRSWRKPVADLDADREQPCTERNRHRRAPRVRRTESPPPTAASCRFCQVGR